MTLISPAPRWSPTLVRLGFASALAVTLMLVASSPLSAAQFTVDVVADGTDETPGDGFCDVGAGGGNHCTLHAAIQEAQALSGADAIVFASGTNGSPITLTLGALPTVSTEIALTGNGAASTVIQSSTCNPVTLPGDCTPAEWRVLTIDTFGILKLANLTLRHGRCNGDCDFSNGGGGVLNQGSLSLAGVTIAENRTVLGSGGGILNRQGTIVSIRDSVLSNNRAGNNGGGIENSDPDGSIGAIVRTRFESNQATFGGGLFAGITDVVANSTFYLNTAIAIGGGIYADGDLGLVTDCTFQQNDAGSYGGGIYTDSENAIGLVTRSLFYGNEAASGGGLNEFDGSMGSITNSTFSGNTASVDGGAIYTNTGTIASIVHVTMHGNSAPLGAAIYSGSNVSVSNSIFGANGSGVNDNCEGTINPVGGNRSDDATCDNGFAIVPGTDYELALADNGGNTKTHALPGGSTAIDDLGACPAEIDGVDQRGAPRDGSCDTGAFEAVSGFLFADGFEIGNDGIWSAAVP